MKGAFDPVCTPLGWGNQSPSAAFRLIGSAIINPMSDKKKDPKKPDPNPKIQLDDLEWESVKEQKASKKKDPKKK